MSMEVNPLQCKKDCAPIAVMEFGIIIDVKPLQYEKALLPIEETELGIVNVPVKPLHS